jgi:hypothetical protein
MKTTIIHKLGLVILIAIFSQYVTAQEKGNKKIVKETRELASFTGINAGGAVSVIIQIADDQKVEVESDENLLDNIKTDVINGVLHIKSNKLKNPSELNVFVYLPSFNMLTSSGATDVKCASLIESSEFKMNASGATTVKLEQVNFDYLESDISGASDVKISGLATTHNINISGAGSFKGKDLKTKKTIYDASGASDSFFYVTEDIAGQKKGAASVSYTGTPTSNIQTVDDDKRSESYVVYTDNYYDSVKVKVGGIKVEVFEGDDSVRIKVGNRELRIDDDGNVKYGRCKPNRFNGHWAGFDLGLNGYVNPDFNMSFPKETEYMDLRMTKSIVVNLNFFEQNVPISKNQKFGTLTGLGLQWNNYRFSHNTRLNSDGSELAGYIDQGISIRKSKLTTFYLNLPILFEFQTNSRHKKNSFHIGTGVVMNVRLSSHTKKYYNERNKEFEVTKYNPETGMYEAEFTAVSPDYSKAKNFDDFYLQPFKFDGTVRIGWGFINLFATLSINQMFKVDKGPELYPWSVGITLVNL